MGKSWKRSWALAGVLALIVGVGESPAQQPPAKSEKPAKPESAKEKPTAAKPEKSKVPSLEEMLAGALKNNPDIRVAEAKLREAEAELNRARLQVTQKVVALHRAWTERQSKHTSAEAAFSEADAALKSWQHGSVDAKQRHFAGSLDEAQLRMRSAEARLATGKEKLAEIEAELPYVMGEQPMKGHAEVLVNGYRYSLLAGKMLSEKELWTKPLGNIIATQPRSEVSGPMADKIRKALDVKVSVGFTGDEHLDELLERLRKATGIHFQYAQTTLSRPVNGQMTAINISLMRAQVAIKLDSVPLGIALQALEDTIPKLRFIPRDYGILVTTETQVPPDATYLNRFWKTEPPLEKPGPNGPEKTKKPSPGVKGAVQEVDSKTGLATVSIGSDAGLEVGNTLEVYRLKPKPEYVGPILVVQVKPTQAIAKPKTRLLAGPIKVGDEVAMSVKP